MRSPSGGYISSDRAVSDLRPPPRGPAPGAITNLVRRKGRLIRRDYTQFVTEIAQIANGRCQARWSVKCWGMGDQVHHRLRRAHGGPDTHTNCRWVCTQCHTDIHANPLEAYVRGLLVRSSVTDAVRAHLEETDR